MLGKILIEVLGMNKFKEKIMSGDIVIGVWNNIDSSVITELISLCKFDWVLLDTEHRPSSTNGILQQLQSVKGSTTFPFVRVPWLDRVPVKIILDTGAPGIMFPSIDTKEQAEEAVSYMRYAPYGVRGVSAGTRACDYGLNFSVYFNSSNENLITIAQIESQKGIDNVFEIAKVDGIDIIFVGPMDLSTSINMPKRFEDEKFINILKKIADETKLANKVAGIQIPNINLLDKVRSLGYNFIAISSDISEIANSLKNVMCKANEIINK